MHRVLLKSLGNTSALTPTKTSAQTTAKPCTQNNDHMTFSIFKIIAFVFLLCSTATITGAAIYPTLLRRKVMKGSDGRLGGACKSLLASAGGVHLQTA
jgi:hypothetical protein